MSNPDWATSMTSLCDVASLITTCNVTDLEFTSGHRLEVYLALNKEQRIKGLSNIDALDLSGMLFCYDQPTWIPFTMESTKINLDIAWYDSSGNLIQSGTYNAGDKNYITCPYAFSYVLETPAGLLPSGNFKISDG